MENFSTCEISDALIKLGSPHGGHLPDIYCVSPPLALSSLPEKGSDVEGIRVEGPAYTVKMVPFHDQVAPKPEIHFVDGVKEDSVVVIDAPLSVKSAVWGGLMSFGARARGAKGVIISGRCRDVLEHREAGLPIFARGTSTLGQRPFTRPSEIEVPLTISSPSLTSVASTQSEEWPAVTINPGDWIVADLDGVVVIPRDQMEAVRELCRKGREVDERCKRDIIAGLGVAESFKKHRGK
ncbi:hypothetical protein FRC19_001365 [Serendipita sp. 401]|nr:hypothetical protein FRC19_001365 [Serendipita sp. 401]